MEKNSSAPFSLSYSRKKEREKEKKEEGGGRRKEEIRNESRNATNSTRVVSPTPFFPFPSRDRRLSNLRSKEHGQQSFCTNIYIYIRGTNDANGDLESNEKESVERGRIRNTWNREVNRTTRTFVSVRKGQRIAEGRWWWEAGQKYRSSSR